MASSRRRNVQERPVLVPAAGTTLQGFLALPEAARGGVLFAHGSGSGRLSPRNRAVAEAVQDAGFATLLLDLLDKQEAEDRRKVFDIDLLATRLLAAAQWLAQEPGTRGLPLGYFGASTGAAAALRAAAWRPDLVAALVSRGGRPDLAMADLPRVAAPTLLIVGARDEPVLALNEAALARLTGPKSLVTIPGATHLFEEPGALDQVAEHALGWFRRHLR